MRKKKKYKQGMNPDSRNGFKKGYTPWNKGKKGDVNSGSFKEGHKHSKKTLKKLSKNRIGKPHPHKGVKGINKGKKNGMWKGGVSPKYKLIRMGSKYKEWRKSIYERDNHTCQAINCVFCKNKRGIKTLQAHHIKNFVDYPLLRFKIENGITYCKQYHLLVEHKMCPKNIVKEINN